MAVIKLSPAFKDYLWGGTRLKKMYQKQTDLDIVVESWEVSTHPDGPSYVVSGVDSGKTLAEYIKYYGTQILGTHAQDFNFFPILVKFIDAKEDLSIQVHPNDEYGLKHEGEYGKTEMWYIVEADPDSAIYYGTKHLMSRDHFAQAIEANTVLDVLNRVTVKKGDVIFVEAGTIHAIGAGIVICEIQQNPNTTYRVYDYNRKDVYGNLRPLHLKQALDVSNLKPLDTDFKPQGDLEVHNNYQKQCLVSCPYFQTSKMNLSGAFEYVVGPESFEAWVVLEGAMDVIHQEQKLSLLPGETLFLEANTKDIHISGTATCLSISV
ncbi:class I mannose-6-phosphate isomerase [Erysipelothrix piscisicarius]|uniref:Phosphohexomutase n=1 Tax=Erysipelothrix piscisicarius TaxID=2485784 RepID=A0A3S8RLT9_9FIRM|nr:type I phosphomannose isomerase catalytic subunit [Erysipelothrix piscisicarius]AZK43905.1 class I mannose-6-phosphate isomerase [Erysipelothrix piscisicarius]